MRLTLTEAKALLACEGGVQVYDRGVLEALDGLSTRQPVKSPLFEAHACQYRRATLEGLRVAKARIRRHLRTLSGVGRAA